MMQIIVHDNAEREYLDRYPAMKNRILNCLTERLFRELANNVLINREYTFIAQVVE